MKLFNIGIVIISMSSEEIYKQYLKDIYRYCYYKLQNKEEAEDIASDTFVKLLEQKDISKIENVKAWMITVARNMIFNKYKQKRVISNLNEDFEDLMIDETVNIELESVNEETLNIVKSHLDKLDAMQKEVIVLKVWEDLKFNEIAHILAINENSVKTIYYRGLSEIKKNMEHESIKKGVSAGSIIASIAALKSEINASEQFIATQISQASSLIINSSNMNSAVSLISQIKTFLVTKPLLTAGVAVVSVTSITGGAIVQSLNAPVKVNDKGQYESNALIKSYTATINFKNESVDETFTCDPSGCKEKYSEYGIPDGTYTVTIVIKNFLGNIVSTETKTVIVDSIMPNVELIYSNPTNNSQFTIVVKSDESVKIFVNNEEKALDSEGKFTLNISDGENKFTVRVVDQGGNEIVKEISTTLDTAIDLTITAPVEGAEVGTKFTVTGTTESGATVTSQGVSTTAGEDGLFTLELNYSAPKVDITSTDKAGNTITKSVTVKSKGPVLTTYTGKYLNFTFQYPASLGKATSTFENQDVGGGNTVPVEIVQIGLITFRVGGYKFWAIDGEKTSFSVTTLNGYKTNVVSTKAAYDITNSPLKTNDYMLEAIIGNGSTQCYGNIWAFTKTLGATNGLKESFRTILTTYKANFTPRCD